MKTIWMLAALIAASAAGAQAAPRAISIDGGLIRGASEGPLVVYKGLPFAAPPLEQRRWRAPYPVLPWQGVRNASSFAPACMQRGASMPGEIPPRVSEDCLYLNVWAPTRGRRPHAVMVFIPGGGFTNGAASMPLYWGDRLARRGVVVVTISYRLGPFGFLATPELTKESGHAASGDQGLLDQIAALQWVQRNIGAFGGDPSRVTVFGQSAGAMSVSLLVTSPLAKGLFRGAIAQSGGVFEPLALAPTWLLKNAEVQGEAYASALGAGSLAALRALPAERLLGAKAASVSHPVVEGYVLPLSPSEAYRAGAVNDVNLLIGFNADEARSLVDLSTVRASSYAADITRSWGASPPALIEAYPHRTDEEAKSARADFERDLRFGWDMWAWSRLHASRGRRPVFSYVFEQKPPFPTASVYSGWGASHFAELWYVFDHLDQAPWRWTRQDRAVAAAMSRYWTNFAKRGDPNGPGTASWPAFTSVSQSVLGIGPILYAQPLRPSNGLLTFDRVYDDLRSSPITSR